MNSNFNGEIEDSNGVVTVTKDMVGEKNITIKLPESVPAPVEQGQVLGYLRAWDGTEAVQEVPLTAPEAVARLGTWDIFTGLLSEMTS